MKRIKLLLAIVLSSVFFTSCVVDEVFNDNYGYNGGISLNELVNSYDLWYVDIHATTGRGEVPYMERAFTLSFHNGTMYANNNIVDIGLTGNGFGIDVGRFYAIDDVLETTHDLDGVNDFRVVQLSANEIRLDYIGSSLSYYLIGYQKNQFDYNKLFYDNIEYFLQEFEAWERTDIQDGVANEFDNEKFLQFTPENNTTFYSSHDNLGTHFEDIRWDFVGSYIIENVRNVDNLKYLTLNYDNGDTEEFDLTVIDDDNIKLLHVATGTKYFFTGRGFIQILRGGEKSDKAPVRNNGRKRTKIKRKTVDKR